MTIYIGETKPRPKPYVASAQGVRQHHRGRPPTVAVLRDGKVYRNLDPLAALPWTYRLTAAPVSAAR